jgi:hypothetical protein
MHQSSGRNYPRDTDDYTMQALAFRLSSRMQNS